ncbi:MAG: hypothetical protein K0U86_23965 [Planctomycetes bacterium]|nr:hypothetical protein [Planctomycetota bacterium]MCH9727971.1 hypothetical protein [Planctomycetota bacterium]MCH9775773.1 hypothetical protein [Planctomycetota bacterium]MCH9792243.1 hypothetical protein [Planctomycetota bacterium]
MLSNSATEQLLTSDAVDQTISSIDFSSLANKKVYFDTSYIKNIKGMGFVNGDYITSSLRQQIVAANCLIQEKKEEADYVIEARVGTLATNGHEVNYGIPASNMLSSAATLVPTAPPIPTIPEISLAKKNNQSASAKISVFAYNQKTRERVWQSGIVQAKSTALDTWILGAGPFQRGTIYKEGAQFAGSKIEIPLAGSDEYSNVSTVDYLESAKFVETPTATPVKKDAKKREVKTLEEWMQSEGAATEKQKAAAAAKASEAETKPAASAETKPVKAETKPVKTVQTIPEVKPDMDPSKIKTDLFLKPVKTISDQTWLKSDPSRISTVWPRAPESVEMQIPQTVAEPDSEEKFEFDNTFRQILTE